MKRADYTPILIGAAVVVVLALLTALLSGCTSMPPRQPLPLAVVVEKKTPVIALCEDRRAPPPALPDSIEALRAAPHPGAEERLMADPNDAEALKQVSENLRYRVQLLAAAWPLKNARLEEDEKQIAACSK